jgi:hypothetical protein
MVEDWLFREAKIVNQMKNKLLVTERLNEKDICTNQAFNRTRASIILKKE